MEQAQKATEKVEITLNEEAAAALAKIASEEKRDMSEVVSAFISKLIEDAEDRYFVELAEERIAENNETISHAELLKRLNITEEDLKNVDIED